MKQYSSAIDCNTTLATSFMEGRKFLIKWGNQGFYSEVGESYNFWQGKHSRRAFFVWNKI